MPDFYQSPRWSGEIMDCSMPMTFDTYSECSYRCVYCFAAFRKAIGTSKKFYLKTKARPVDVRKVKALFNGEIEKSQFNDYIGKRLMFQWGGMADPFDENEREQGVSLELLRFFREIEYPVSISTKGTWWIDDPRYAELLKGARHIHLKVSIITTDVEKAKITEALVPTPLQRLHVLESAAKLGIGGVTLRLRPYIIGISDKTVKHLLAAAAGAGADSVSTEFLCVEARSKEIGKQRYAALAKAAGYDVFYFYRHNSPGLISYLRLHREIKRPYIEEMRSECERLGLRLYVSDAHFKETCQNGSCCGLQPGFNYSRGQFTEALVLAKRNGRVTWSEIEPGLDYASFPFVDATGYNPGSSERRAQFHSFTMRDFIHWNWNNVNGLASPYKYFGGVLKPAGVDEKGDVIYEYAG